MNGEPEANQFHDSRSGGKPDLRLSCSAVGIGPSSNLKVPDQTGGLCPHMLWRPVRDFLDYEVSEHGDLRRGVKHLTPERVQGSGRKRFALSKGGCRVVKHAAHLVADAFIGPKPFEGAEVCHNDGFFHNNHYSNLRWDTHAGNMADKVKHRHQRNKSLGRNRPEQGLSAATSAFLAKAS